MKTALLHGAALALTAMAMTAPGEALAGLGEPPIACTEALYGQEYTTSRYRPATGWVYTTYQCQDPGVWQLYMVCDDYGCVLY